VALLEVRGFRCFYAEFGRGEPATVLLHGWSGDSTDWTAQIPDLAERSRVIAIDLRGHGRSQATPDGYEAEELAWDVIAVLDRLALKPADLIGHSLGGILASFISLRRPDLVRSLLLVDPAYGQPPARCAEVEAIIGDPSSADSEARATEAADLPSPLSDEANRRRSVRRRLQAEGLGSHVVWETFRGMFCGPGGLGVLPASEALVRDRKHPTLAIYAYRPTWEWERRLSATPDRCLLWEDVSHFLHDDQPARFNAAALEWLAEVDRGQAP
jgi:pimeloyl-ACP methyl ester carboxylesterase